MYESASKKLDTRRCQTWKLRRQQISKSQVLTNRRIILGSLHSVAHAHRVVDSQ